MIQEIIGTLDLIKINMPFVLTIVAVLWGLQIVNYAVGYRLNIFGIYPRHPMGLIGIVTSPFLHGNFNHLFFNSIPLVVMLSLVMLQGKQIFVIASISIILISGTGIWLFGRKAIHIGASGVIMGYLGFLLMNIYSQGTVVAMGIGIVCLYYFSSLLLSIFPGDVKSSWEGHLFGLIAGIATSYFLPYLQNL